ncbi:sn-1-specific diacylglycerol lipase ABHD11-like [Battus philenor]|uniref:sn-1-specific diacylglycerol lipase ABHD11-like n=1 Tax=Battus philenor TaxID=42288 RepID=UPI0035CF0024
MDTVLATQDDAPLIILHDLLSNKKQWSSIGKTINNLSKRAVITVDLRNHGKSPHTRSNTYEEMTADLQKLLQKLSIEKAYFLGHGIGGKATMCTALLAPEAVAGMMIIDISPASSPKQFQDLYAEILTSMKEIKFKSGSTLVTAKSEAKKILKNSKFDDLTVDVILSNIVLKTHNIVGWSCNLDVLIKYFHYVVSFPKNLKGKIYYGPTIFIGGQLSEFLP